METNEGDKDPIAARLLLNLIHELLKYIDNKLSITQNTGHFADLTKHEDDSNK